MTRPDLTLSIVDEKAVLTEAYAGVIGDAPPWPNAWAQVEGADAIPPEALSARLAGKVGGPAEPAWAGGADGAWQGDTLVCRVDDVWIAPRFGAVLDAQGRVFRSTVGEALSWKPDLSALPGVAARGEARLFRPPAEAPVLDGASVFMAKGGEFNYGHFLLDCLTALLSLEETGLVRALPPLAPVLSPWARALIAEGFPDMAVHETPAPIVRARQAAFSTAMDHLLHRPNDLVPRLRARFLRGGPHPPANRRVYISRRAYPMRVMVNEAELEAALQARGFDIVRAEALSAREQIALMRQAQVIVGATGAGLTNGLFAPDGAKLFEIQPETFTSTWLRDMAHRIGLDWYGYFCRAPVAAHEVSWRYRIRRGFRWGYRLDLEGFLAFLDERL